MSAEKEFYYDDLVLFNDLTTKISSIGVVTKEKPFKSDFLKSLDKVNPESLTEIENESTNDKENTNQKEYIKNNTPEDDGESSSDGNLYDPPQIEMVNVSWFIHKYLAEISDNFENHFIESVPGKNLQLLDRDIDLSDIVKYNFIGHSKVGTVVNMKITADVMLLGLNKIISNVNCTRMKWIEPFMGKNLETNYTYESWLGEVLDIAVEVVVRFSDGARLKVPDSALSQFDHQIHSVWNPIMVLENCVMKGEALDLRTRKSKFLSETARHNSKWLLRVKSSEIVQVLVEKVLPTHADMQWVFGYNNKGSNPLVPDPPPQTLKGKQIDKLEPIHPFPWHSVSVGDVWYYHMSPGDKLLDCGEEEDVQRLVYKMLNRELSEFSLCEENLDPPLANDDIQAAQVRVVDCQYPGAGYVVKPRKKILCSSKSRIRRRCQSYSSNKAISSDEEPEDGPPISSTPSVEQREVRDLFRREMLARLRDQKLQTQEPISSGHHQGTILPVGVLLTRCLVDVHWQDGSVSLGVPTTDLIPQMYSIDEHDFFPGDFVVEKFDPFSTASQRTTHNFGTVIKSNTKDRVATIQWFDLAPPEPGTAVGAATAVVKSGTGPEEVGVYDIAALNERHFVLGQEVIVRQEAAHGNYPACYVSRLLQEDGKLVVRWPDGEEAAVSPTDLLLTVESAVGGGEDGDQGEDDEDDPDNHHDMAGGDSDGGGGGGGVGGGEDDYSSDDLQSESGSSDWETVDEEEADLNQDKLYLDKLKVARAYMERLRRKIGKIIKLLSNVTGFTLMVQAHLPPHMGQLLNVQYLFPPISGTLTPVTATTTAPVSVSEPESVDQQHGNRDQAVISRLEQLMAGLDHSPLLLPHDNIDDVTEEDSDLSLLDQQNAFKNLFEIRQSIAVIYKACNDVEIKRMFQQYRPKEFISFRNIKNFIVSHMQFKPTISPETTTSNDHSVNREEPNVSNGVTEHTVSEDQLPLEADSTNPKTQQLLADYMTHVYKDIISNLNYLLESIDVWLREKSYYLQAEDDMDIQLYNGHTQYEGLPHDAVMRLSQQPEQQDDLGQLLAAQDDGHGPSQLIGDCPEPSHLSANPSQHVVSSGSESATVPSLIRPPVHADSDRTMSNCEPIPEEQRGTFIISESAPSSHHYINSAKPSLASPKFNRAWKRDIKLLTTSLPKGVITKSYDDRIDLFSVMIVGPGGTPYEHALFFFDIQLGLQYPSSPPSVYFVSLASERVNPNLYTEGRVCLSLLGTWNGKGSENWDSKLSSLLQLIVSLQGLILVSEPYYNEAGFEIKKGSADGRENSQRYNENAINNICLSMINLLNKPIASFDSEIRQHFLEFGHSLVSVHSLWSSLTEEILTVNIQSSEASPAITVPEFPLAPVSRGFQLSMSRHIETLRRVLGLRLSQWTAPVDCVT